MLIEHNHQIDYELDINLLIPGVVLDSFIYKQTSLWKNFYTFWYFLNTFLCI